MPRRPREKQSERQIPWELEEICARALALDPAERYGTFWQVMGDPNTPAKTLLRLLKDQGFSVVLIAGRDKETWIVVGPYHDPQSLAQAKAKLEAAGFHVLREW